MYSETRQKGMVSEKHGKKETARESEPAAPRQERDGKKEIARESEQCLPE